MGRFELCIAPPRFRDAADAEFLACAPTQRVLPGPVVPRAKASPPFYNAFGRFYILRGSVVSGGEARTYYTHLPCPPKKGRPALSHRVIHSRANGAIRVHKRRLGTKKNAANDRAEQLRAIMA